MRNNIECDTNFLRESAKDILVDCAEIETKINHFFSKLNNIPETAEWTGNNAVNYSDQVAQEKDLYLRYINGYKDIANELERFCESLDDTVRRNEQECDW